MRIPDPGISLLRPFLTSKIYEKCRPKTSEKPLKNLWRPRTFQEPLGGFPEVFKCCPFEKDNIWKPKTSQKPFWKPSSHFRITKYDCNIASKITIYKTISTSKTEESRNTVKELFNCVTRDTDDWNELLNLLFFGVVLGTACTEWLHSVLYCTLLVGSPQCRRRLLKKSTVYGLRSKTVSAYNCSTYIPRFHSHKSFHSHILETPHTS